MRILIWCLRVALFLLLLGLAIKNDGVVTVRFFFDGQWRIPLAVVLLLGFVGGALLGATATVSTMLSQYREIRRLKKGGSKISEIKAGVGTTDVTDVL